MSPIFPEITDFQKIIECSQSFVAEYWFENLNLRGSYKESILSYINEKYPQYANLYEEIYRLGRMEYWDELACRIEEYCRKNQIRHINYFYHDKLVKEKLEKKR